MLRNHPIHLDHLQFLVRPHLAPSVVPPPQKIIGTHNDNHNGKGKDKGKTVSNKPKRYDNVALRCLLGILNPNVLNLSFDDLWTSMSSHLQSASHCVICVIGDLREVGLMDGTNLVTYTGFLIRRLT
jgi:hypothetical protein